MTEEHDTPLEISRRTEGDRQIIAAAGDLDLTTVARLRTVVTAVMDQEPSARIVLDLQQLEYIDSAGISLLLEVMRALKPQGRALPVVVEPASQPARALKLCHLDRIIQVAHSLEEIG